MKLDTCLQVTYSVFFLFYFDYSKWNLSYGHIDFVHVTLFMMNMMRHFLKNKS